MRILFSLPYMRNFAHIMSAVQCCVVRACIDAAACTQHTGTIKGCGPKTATEWITKHKSIAGVMKSIDSSKHPPPDPFNHEEIHAFFHEPEVSPTAELKEKGLLTWKEPDFDGMRKFLVEGKQFNADRIENVITRLKKTAGTNTQARLDSFFVKKDPPAGFKRPAPAPTKGKDPKKGKFGAGGGKSAMKKGK